MHVRLIDLLYNDCYFVVDSRCVGSGNTFVALKTTQQTTQCIYDAISKNARHVILQQTLCTQELRDYASTKRCELYEVQDPHNTILHLAKIKRMQLTGQIIGITGSVGKTTVKDMLRHILSKFASCYAAPLSYNNKIGLPIALLNAPRNLDYYVFEVGIDQVGAMHSLAELLQPNLCIVTGVFSSHIGNFESDLVLAHEKYTILSYVAPNGHVVLLEQPKYQTFLLQAKSKNTSITKVSKHAWRVLYNSARYIDVISQYATPGMMQNAILALNAVQYYLSNIKINDINILSGFVPQKHRLNIYKIPVTPRHTTFLIDDTFNSSAESVYNALLQLSKINGAKCIIFGGIAATGDMIFSQYQLMHTYLSLIPNLTLILCGEHALLYLRLFSQADLISNNTYKVMYCNSIVEATDLAFHYINDVEILLIKGPRDTSMEVIVECILRFYSIES